MLRCAAVAGATNVGSGLLRVAIATRFAPAPLRLRFFSAGRLDNIEGARIERPNKWLFALRAGDFLLVNRREGHRL